MTNYDQLNIKHQLDREAAYGVACMCVNIKHYNTKLQLSNNIFCPCFYFLGKWTNYMQYITLHLNNNNNYYNNINIKQRSRLRTPIQTLLPGLSLTYTHLPDTLPYFLLSRSFGNLGSGSSVHGENMSMFCFNKKRKTISVRTEGAQKQHGLTLVPITSLVALCHFSPKWKARVAYF